MLETKKLMMILDLSKPLTHPLQPFGDMPWANGRLQCCHVVRQHQQHGVGAVEGQVED